MSVKNLMTIYLTFRNWIFCFSILLFSTGTLRSEAIITFEHSGGRLGDNLISYLHAKWLSYTTGIPLQCNYCGFKYAKSLRMFSKEVDFSHAPHPSVNLYVNKMDFQFRPAESVCYIIPYFPEFESELDTGAYKRLVAVDWEDPDFRDIALDMISSTIPLRLMLPPANMVNVALHLREGGNFDVDDVRFKFPLKLPPLHFYCDALKKVAALFQGQPIHCQIFTDAINPEVLVELIKKELPSGHNIQFDYRKQANDDEDNVLDDFGTVQGFGCWSILIPSPYTEEGEGK